MEKIKENFWNATNSYTDIKIWSGWEAQPRPAWPQWKNLHTDLWLSAKDRLIWVTIRGLGLLTRRRTNPIPNECKRGGHIHSSKKLRFHLGSIKPMRKIKSRGQASSMSRIWRMSQQHGGAIWRGEHACGDKFGGAERRRPGRDRAVAATLEAPSSCGESEGTGSPCAMANSRGGTCSGEFVRSGRRLLIFRAANGGAAAAERTERREMELGFALALWWWGWSGIFYLFILS
jgi:hypothetical protein